MSRLLTKVYWSQLKDRNTEAIGDNIYRDPIEITDMVDMNGSRGLDIRNNIISFTVKNSQQKYDSFGNIIRDYINESDFTIQFQEQDQIKIYTKYTDDAADLGDDSWENSSTLRGTYYVIEYNIIQNQGQAIIKVTAADKTYIIFNRLMSKAFTASDGKTTPEIVQDIVRYSSQNDKGQFLGSGSNPNVRYDIDAKLVSEGGYIQDTRKSTTESGAVNGDTDFPEIAIGKVWKPVYEWINDLSQIENLNTSSELTNDVVYGKPFVFWVDETNKFHWEEASSVVSTTILHGTTRGVYEYNFTKKVFDTVNMIIFRGGEDLYGTGTLSYLFDETTNIKTVKMKVIPMTDIAKKLIQAEILKGNLVENTSGSFTFGGNRYNRNGTVTPAWTSTSYSSDDNYNDALREEVLRLGTLRARNIIRGVTNARWKGTLTVKGNLYTAGSLFQITNRNIGMKDQKLRLISIRDTINKNGWSTTLELEEDEKTLVGKVS